MNAGHLFDFSNYTSKQHMINTLTKYAKYAALDDWKKLYYEILVYKRKISIREPYKGLYMLTLINEWLATSLLDPNTYYEVQAGKRIRKLELH